MKKALKTRWVEALRSGKYKKTTSVLCKVGENGEKSFCCLGVLAEISPTIKKTNKNVATEMLSGKALDFAGFSITEAETLAGMNDGDADYVDKPKSFKQIASYIEKNL